MLVNVRKEDVPIGIGGKLLKKTLDSPWFTCYISTLCFQNSGACNWRKLGGCGPPVYASAKTPRQDSWSRFRRSTFFPILKTDTFGPDKTCFAFQIIYSIRYVLPFIRGQFTKDSKKKRHSAQIIPSLEPHIRHAAIESYADALRVVFICQAAIGLLGILPCLVIDESPRLCVRDTTAWIRHSHTRLHSDTEPGGERGSNGH